MKFQLHCAVLLTVPFGFVIVEHQCVCLGRDLSSHLWDKLTNKVDFKNRFVLFLFFVLFFLCFTFLSNFPQRKHYSLQPWSLFLCESLCKDSFCGTYTLLDSPQWGEIKAVKGTEEKKRENTCPCWSECREKKHVFEAQVRSLSF